MRRLENKLDIVSDIVTNDEDDKYLILEVDTGTLKAQITLDDLSLTQFIDYLVKQADLMGADVGPYLILDENNSLEVAVTTRQEAEESIGYFFDTRDWATEFQLVKPSQKKITYRQCPDCDCVYSDEVPCCCDDEIPI